MRYTLLLVDDDPNVLEGLRRRLRKEDCEIVCATSAVEALMKLHREPIDAVISDQKMPGMKGLEFLKKVKEEVPHVLCVLLTGETTLEIALQALNEGNVDRFFTKPCKYDEIAITIRQYFQQRDLKEIAGQLLDAVQKQNILLKRLEKRSPGITKIERDASGAIHIDNISDNFEDFMKKAHKVAQEAEKNLT